MQTCFSIRILATLIAVVSANAIAATPATDARAGTVVVFDLTIAAQPLPQALRAFSRQTGVQVAIQSELAEGKTAAAVAGKYEPADALAALLEGTGLTSYRVNDNTYGIRELSTLSTAAGETLPANDAPLRLAQSTPPSSPVPPAAASAATRSDAPEAQNIGEVVVTGTRIRGGSLEDLPAPSIAITREDFVQAGFTGVQDIFEVLPQNFDNSSSEAARGTGNTNQSGNGVNLRGLGADATLILVNGRRRSPRNNGVTDIRGIPLGMLERVEVVTGGRSAMYGSDAVSGVVNFVTRRDFEGLEIGSQYGLGKHSEPRLQADILTGMKHARGGFALGYEYYHEDQFDALETGLVANPDFAGRRYNVEPLRGESRRQSVMGAGHLYLTDGLELYFDSLYSEDDGNSFRSGRALNAIADSESNDVGSTREYNAVAGLKAALPAGWQLSTEAQLAGAKGRAVTDSRTVTGATVSLINRDNRIEDTDRIASMQLEGPLPAIAGIRPRLAMGAEYREQEGENELFTISNGSSLAPNRAHADRDIRSLFAEVLLPLVTGGERPGLRRLQLSLAGRHERYSDFGDTFTPEGGLLWKPLERLTVRASYSEAFKAPAIRQILSPLGTPLLVNRPDPTQPDQVATVLQISGNRLDIGPEEARTWSVGFDFEPAFAERTRLSVSYFDIDYHDRIGIAASGSDVQLILARDAFADIIKRAPSAQEVDAFLALVPTPVSNSTSRPLVGPANGSSILASFPDLVLVDLRTGNLASDAVRGLDLALNVRQPSRWGELDFGLHGSWQIEHVTKVVSSSPELEKLNEVARPLDLRLRASAGLSRGRWNGHFFLNHLPSYDNPYQTPVGRMASWTTVDLTLGAQIDLPKRSFWADNLRVVLGARNVFDRDPPPMHGPLIAGQVLRYDPTNANAEGRILTLRLVTDWR